VFNEQLHLTTIKALLKEDNEENQQNEQKEERTGDSDDMFSDNFTQPVVTLAPPSPHTKYAKTFQFLSFQKDSKIFFEKENMEKDVTFKEEDSLSESSSSGEQEEAGQQQQEQEQEQPSTSTITKPITRYKSIGKWEIHTAGIGSKLMTLMGFVEV
jgi:hypothetical protein